MRNDIMTFELPKLDYEFDSLEPYVDALTMEIHYSKHHAGYTAKLNAALEGTEHASTPIEELLSSLDSLPSSLQGAVRNNGGGYYNHLLFWKMLSPKGGGEPQGVLLEKITAAFGSFDAFKADFEKAAMGQFGSGWAWLVQEEDGSVVICSTANQDTPLSEGKHVLLGVDVWEHAYYKKYGPARAEYLQQIWNVINWDYVSSRLR